MIETLKTVKEFKDFLGLKRDRVKKINGYNGYSISENGVVFKHPYIDKRGASRKGRLISNKIDKFGYHSVSLWANGRNNFFLVHRLVALNFIEPSSDKLRNQVNHIDGNKSNNHVSNLEWVSDKENKMHSMKHSLNAKGSRNGKSKLNECQVKKIKKLISEGVFCRVIADIYNVHETTIFDIKRGKTWKHIKLTDNFKKLITG